jgi:WD40 repeat protein
VGDALTSTSLTLRNWKAEPKIQTIQGHRGSVRTLIELKDDALASGSWDGIIKLWKRDGACLATFKGHTSGVSLIELKDGTLATASDDNTIKLWTFPLMN